MSLTRPFRAPAVGALLTAALLALGGCAPTGSGAVTAPTTVANPAATAAPAGTPAQQLETVARNVDQAITAAQGGDLAAAKQAFAAYDAGWDGVEDGVKAKSSAAYKAIEDAMDDVKVALVKNAAPSQEGAVAALQKLRQVINAQKPALGG